MVTDWSLQDLGACTTEVSFSRAEIEGCGLRDYLDSTSGLRFPEFPVSRASMSDTATIPTHARTSDFRRKESVGWLIQLTNREDASPKRPYECS